MCVGIEPIKSVCPNAHLLHYKDAVSHVHWDALEMPRLVSLKISSFVKYTGDSEKGKKKKKKSVRIAGRRRVFCCDKGVRACVVGLDYLAWQR